MKDLNHLREQIDVIDDAILRLYEERMQLTQEVAEYKIQTGKKVLDHTREEEKLQRLSAQAKSDFTRVGITELFEHIMAVSRKRQYQMIAEKIGAGSDFVMAENLPMEGATVVFQGVEGAYSQQAMFEYFGKECKHFPVATWRDAMEAIRTGQADYAVLPIENSSAGIVSENYDLLVEYDNYIVDEQILPIRHVLMGMEGAKEKEIRQVYSHPQALMQCSNFLYEQNDWEKISVGNTALAAKKVKEEADPHQAAIASPLTAELYGLSILREKICDSMNNATKFVIVSSKRQYKSTANRISLCFEVAHRSGALYHTLSHFIYNNINMTNIQSRPIKDRSWEYRFFVEIEGNLDDTGVINALTGIAQETEAMKILGTYTAFEAK